MNDRSAAYRKNIHHTMTNIGIMNGMGNLTMHQWKGTESNTSHAGTAVDAFHRRG